jgi:DNA/RNA-binding domain of Phe-tRNA-synthetase-like protein
MANTPSLKASSRVVLELFTGVVRAWQSCYGSIMGQRSELAKGWLMMRAQSGHATDHMPPDYEIDQQIFRLNPGYRRGLVLAQELSNAASAASLLADLRTQEAALRAEVQGNPAEHPRIASWRDAYRRFGARASEFRSSIEALARRVLRGDALPSINSLVDIGNLLSLRYLVPVGVHPVPLDAAPLRLRLTQPGDSFLPPDGGPAESPQDGEVVFAQGSSILTRRWTWRQAALTLTLPETQAVFFNVDALEGVSDEALSAALRDIEHLVRTHCGGRTQSTVLSAANPRWSLLAR